MDEPESVPRPDWSPLPREGCVNVEGKVLYSRDGVGLAMLRFGPEATIDEHSAAHDTDVICLDGAGFISVEDRVHTFRGGQSMRWPAGLVHRLWTADESMFTLMVERHD